MRSIPTQRHAIKNVLLVDDTINDIALTRRALARIGMTVHLEVLQDFDTIMHRIKDGDNHSQSMFDLILINLNMSKVDGHELVGLLRRFNKTTQTPIVVISTSSDEEEVLYCYTIGANSFIYKADDFTVYAQTLHEVCSYWLENESMPTRISYSVS